MRPLRCVATSFGSAGDFLPTLAIAAALQRRGHDVRFVANPSYESRVRNAGLPMVPAGAPFDLFAALESTPAYVDPKNFGLLLRDVVAPEITATHAVMHEMLRSEPADVVFVNDFGFGALWAAAAHEVPAAIVTATPLFWPSWRVPAVLGDRPLLRVLERPVSAIARPLLAVYMDRFLRPLARTIGTELRDVSFAGSARRAAAQLGMWSPLLRGPATGDPPNGVICGWTRASALGGPEPGLAPEVESFLESGPPPVVVGFGSAFSLTAESLLTDVAHACVGEGLRCLVVGHPDGFEVPPGALAVRYAPYDRVFPRAAAVVVHGGAGTTGEALRSGRPVVGLPFGFDQLTLCAWIERLGVGARLPSRTRTRADLAGALRRVLREDVRRRAAETAPRFAAERDGAETAADVLERLADRARRG